MTRDTGIKDAVENARALLRGIGYECGTTMDELELWFQADTPYDQGVDLDFIVKVPLLVAHELVEIEKVKAMGLRLTKDVIVKNMEKVDDAHLEATKVEMALALSMRDVRHLNERMGDLRMWLEDPSVTAENKRRYAALREDTLQALAVMESEPGP